ncbi:MAG: hypothetical protein Q9170_001688 [Blastenia crenularia]
MVEILSEHKVIADQEKLSGKTLRDSLDVLLERYLHRLHEYQSLQQNLAGELSSGYFSLAQANFSNPNRMRYGQDCYDERMQALTRLNISPRLNATPIAQDTISISILQPISKQLGAKRTEEDGGRDSESIEKDAEIAAPIPDPLKWFGILVPPALRASQSSFKSAVTEAVPSLANVTIEMRTLEIEIRRTRKKMGKASS